jgi:hypothetical protein
LRWTRSSTNSISSSVQKRRNRRDSGRCTVLTVLRWSMIR